MNGFMGVCVERYLELANIPKAKLKTASNPSLDERSIVDQDLEDPGGLSSNAAKLLMNIL